MQSNLTEQVRAHIAKEEARMGEGTDFVWQAQQSRVLASVKGFKSTANHPVYVVSQCGTFCSSENSEPQANAHNIAYLHNTWAADLELVKGLLGRIHQERSPSEEYNAQPCWVCAALQSWLTAREARYKEVYGEG